MCSGETRSGEFSVAGLPLFVAQPVPGCQQRAWGEHNNGNALGERLPI